MIINLWSTPRTGSVWYAHHLQSQYPQSFLASEIFNIRHFNLYYNVLPNGKIESHHQYVEGSYYHEFSLDSQGFLTKVNVYAARQRTAVDEQQHRFSCVKNHSPQQTIIVSNHVDPIHPEIKSWLITQAEKNIWIERRDKRAQLASYAVASSTKQFVQFQTVPQDNHIVPDCNLGLLADLIKRIQIWDQHDKTHVVAFEDIDFHDRPGFPKDQNTDAWSRLSIRVQEEITVLVDSYEKTKSQLLHEL